MTTTAMLNTLLRQWKNAEEAEQAWVDATKVAFPLEARVRYTYRRGNGRYHIVGPVVGHGGTGFYAGHITIKNELTGKPTQVSNAAWHVERGELELWP